MSRPVSQSDEAIEGIIRHMDAGGEKLTVDGVARAAACQTDRAGKLLKRYVESNTVSGAHAEAELEAKLDIAFQRIRSVVAIHGNQRVALQQAAHESSLQVKDRMMDELTKRLAERNAYAGEQETGLLERDAKLREADQREQGSAIKIAQLEKAVATGEAEAKRMLEEMGRLKDGNQQRADKRNEEFIARLEQMFAKAKSTKRPRP